jgi:hypothetical protein
VCVVVLRCLMLAAVAVSAVALTAGALGARAPAAKPKPRPWLVFQTQLSWTRTAKIVSEVDGVECVSEARMTARSKPFYVGRHPAPNYRHRLRYGAKPDTPWFQKGAGYNPDTDEPRPSAVARVVAGETKCGNTILHPECSGVFTGRIKLHGFGGGIDAETRREFMHWSHRSPTPPTPPLPQSCLRGEDRWHALAAIGLMVSGGPTIRHIGTMTIPSPKSLMLSKRRFTLTWTKRDFQWLGGWGGGPPPSDGKAVTSAIFVRVR